MYVTAQTLDDLLRHVFEKLLNTKTQIVTSRGVTVEVTGILLKLNNPRARLSLTETRGRVFSGLGELLWYLSGSNALDFISYYIREYKKDSDDGITIYGGYGPRLFKTNRSINQVSNVVALLKKKPNSRRAVIQLFDAKDINGKRKRKEIPCTCTLQFLIRNNQLHMLTSMRSNDAYLGLPHDIFSFTMLQELIARDLGIELGFYKHFVGSLHLYVDDFIKAKQYLGEGFQSTIPMPPMPLGSPWQSVDILLKSESSIRCDTCNDKAPTELDSYWADLERLLQIFRQYKKRNLSEITRIKGEMVSQVFHGYIQRQQKTLQPANDLKQMPLPFVDSRTLRVV